MGDIIPDKSRSASFRMMRQKNKSEARHRASLSPKLGTCKLTCPSSPALRPVSRVQLPSERLCRPVSQVLLVSLLP
jgi:hypothetical protein